MSDTATAPARPPGGRLLEREGELSSIHALLEDAVAGRAHMALVEGRAGLGKSRLLVELRHAAQGRGLRVLGARGSELEAAFPDGAVRQLFEPLLAHGEARERLLGGAAASARTVFETPGNEGEAPQDGSVAALHGLYWLTVNVAGDGPLVMAIDDLHWCDKPSLRFFAYLVRRL
ncbi:MAG TPA: AAA family ATPase, partial [Thermoleophilaceae bacterium]|nr:AAA family ATPase [Thermoleophilaceae bacterium]